MKLAFYIGSTESIKGVTGDNGYSHQAINQPTTVHRGDWLSIDLKPNAYLGVDAPWRLLTLDNRVLPWVPRVDLSSDEIIDHGARQLAMRRPA